LFRLSITLEFAIVMRIVRSSLLAAPALALATPAVAHVGGGLAGGLAAGAAHPLGGFDHLLAMVAVGIWAAQLGGRASFGLPLAFLGAMALGGGLGLLAIGAAPVELAIVGSVAVLGLAIAFGGRVPGLLAGAVVALFGLAHGHAHGLELAAGANALTYAAGFLAATAVLHAAGLLAALGLKKIDLQPAVRASGGAIAAAGVVLLVA
jgi:urease accessory protein